jgi:hypothetical protein
MEREIDRFVYCDPGFYPYLEEVLARFPEGIREDILSDKSFQIVAKKSFNERYISRYIFKMPVKYLVCLDTKILNMPKYEIIYTIAHEIAAYAVSEGKSDFDEKKVEPLLISWGFEKETKAVRHEHTIAESEGFRIAYEWAKKQSKNYLLQHFGLFFDEWNEKGLGKTSKEGSAKMYDQAETSSMFTELDKSKSLRYHEHDKHKVIENHAIDEEMLAGIMTAMKEIELRM